MVKNKEMLKFERWMRRYWAGVPIAWNGSAEEYEGKVQIAWEVWIYHTLTVRAKAAVDKASTNAKNCGVL